MVVNKMNINNELHNTVIEEKKIHAKTEESSLLTINGTIVVIAVSFIIFTIIMQKIFYSPLAKISEKRRLYIKTIKDEATGAFEENEKLNNEYSEKIKSTRKKAMENTTKILDDANQEKIKILTEKKQDVLEFLNIEKTQIQEEKHKNLEKLKENIGDYAFNISKKILEEDIPLAGVSAEAINKVIKN